MNQLVPQVQQPVIEQDADAIDATGYLHFFLDHLWMITAIALVVTMIGVAYAFLAKPTYEANIMIQLEDNPRSPSNMLGDLSTLFDIKTAASAEMEVLRSRMVVSKAVDNARSFIAVEPKYFPGIGNWIARNNQRQSEPGLLGYGGYVWGGEQAEVSTFAVPPDLEGVIFILTAEGNDGFRLTQDELGISLEGKIDFTLMASTESGDIVLHVDRIAAKPGAQFFLTRKPRSDTIEKLQNRLVIAEKGKQSSIIGVSLEGTDPVMTSRVLNEIGREYIRQNVNRKSDEAEKSLAFLDRQLPALKKELEQSETKLNEFRNHRGTMNLGEETKTILQKSVVYQTKMVELKQKKEELLARFHNDHPQVQSVNQQILDLQRRLATIDTTIKDLPNVEQDVFRLSRDVKINTDLYTALLTTAQQLRLVPTAKGGNARLIDTAVTPNKPVKPKRLVVICLAALLGLALGVAAALTRKTLYRAIEAPREIKQTLGLPISATIPHSDSQEKLYAQLQGKTKKVSVLAHAAPFDIAIESLRSFRASLEFAMLNSKNNIIVITSPTPEVGKSFVSANFSAVLGSVGKKVLLIDGDLRTGYLHRYFGLDRKNGLSDIVTGNILFNQAIHKDVVENVDFIATGSLPLKPAELMAHANFGKLLELLSKRYDFVLIDTAPVLAVSDALIAGAHAGAIFGIVRGGLSTLGEIEETATRLNQAGQMLTGVVFNDARSRFGRYGYGSRLGRYLAV